jgi:hypothetical protein
MRRVERTGPGTAALGPDHGVGTWNDGAHEATPQLETADVLAAKIPSKV